MDSKFNIKNTHVPDKVYAYMIQSFHMLYALIDCKNGDVVSMEVFDDVGISREDGTSTAIQLKSVTSNANPVSDHSTDMWKTFYNWLMGVKDGELVAEKTSFKLFITVDKTGTIVKSFNDAVNQESANQTWEEAKGKFYDKGIIKSDIPESYKKYIETFFDDSNKCISVKIIERFSLECCDKNYSEAVENKARALLIPEDLFKNIFDSLIGWINRRIAKLIESDKNIFIGYDEFIKQAEVLYREFNQRYSLISVTKKPSECEIENEISKNRRYIEQLDLIETEYEDVIRAINDYLVASSDRTKWATDGFVSEKQMLEYEESLLSHWKYKKTINDIELKSATDVEKGKVLYYKCLENKLDMQTYTVPEPFYNGCLHSLSDELRIGWHPLYKRKIGEDESNES